jgi:aminoglycoside phosphotransferase (APT) family kinase protein
MSPDMHEAVAGLDFDEDTLRAYLAERGHLGELEIARIGGGQSNPTYFVTVGNEELVLRKQPAGTLVRGAHNVLREHRIMHALAQTSVPVPVMIASSDDRAVLGTDFFLMSRVAGRLFHEMTLRDAPAAQRRPMYLEHARAMAALHAVDYRAIGLGDLERPGSFVSRQIVLWTKSWGDDRADDVRTVSEWLAEHQPRSDRRTLVHGDAKINNLIYDPTGTDLVAILDWELASVGEPMFDLAHIWASTWGTKPEEYGGVLGVDLAAAQLPTDEEFLGAYYAASDSDEPFRPFHKVFGLFRYAGIFHGIGQRAAEGTATAANAEQQGRNAHIYLDRALEVMAGAD